MRWQRAARLGLAATGLTFAVVLWTMTRERPPEETPPPAPPPDLINAKEFSGAGRLKIERGGKEIGEITFERSSTFPDGRSRFDKVRFVDVRGFEVSADVAHTVTKTPGARPSDFDFQGHVVFKDDGGLLVQTEAATYRDTDGVLTMPQVVTFTRGRISGQGTGAVYHRDTDTVQFLADAVARVAPGQDGKGAADATAKTMTLMRGQKMLRMEENAQITADTETLAGKTAAIYFTDDESAVRFLELRGQASVLPKDPAASTMPAMRANDITLGFHPDGRTIQHGTLTGAASMQLAGGARSVRANWIDLFVAPDGKTLTKLEGRDNVVVTLPATDKSPAREIRSATLLASGRDDKGLETAQFQQDVRFTERPSAANATERTATARTLILSLAGELDAINRAEFQRDAVFVDGNVRGEADVLIYESARNALALRQGQGTARRLSRVTDDKFEVNSPQIDVNLETDDLSARGGVTTTSKGGGTKRSSALFDSSESMHGNAAEFSYQRKTGTATYTGKPGAPARVVQATNEIEGPDIRLADETGNLNATGGVRTVFTMTGAGADDKPVQYRTDAQTFAYDDGKRLATYRSAPKSRVTMVGTDKSEVLGQSIVLTLAEQSRDIVGFRADADVFAKLADGNEVKGTTLTYTAKDERYVLTGEPAQVKSVAADKKDCVRTYGTMIEFTGATGTPRQPDTGMLRRSERMPCAESIR